MNLGRGALDDERRSTVSTIGLVIVMALTVGTVVYLVGTMIRSIQTERKKSGVTKVWTNFGLSIALAILFFTTWFGQGIAQWQTFVDEQRAHDEPVRAVDFAQEFAQSTLENWQSEFLQLFTFVVMAALLIHRGSAESKDSDERMEEILKRIEKKLGA
jgi:hypothetical protein